MEDKIWVRIEDKRPRTPWTFPISLFRDYQIDNDIKLNECFEFDWSTVKLPKMSEQELADVKEECRKAYKVM